MPEPAPPFGETLLFGVATSDHQCEAYQPGREDLRDVWESQAGRTPRGRATDFAHRYEEDIALARGLGCRVFRISLSWARLEPTPGVFDDLAFEHYRQVLRAIRAAGMHPLVTLLHFTWPLHVEERGGLTAADFPRWFGSYTEQVAQRLGTEADLWVSFNEPSQLVFGYLKPFWAPDYFMPPGMPPGATFADQAEAVAKLIRNVFVGHTRARALLKAGNPHALVGANPMVLGLPGWLQWLVDRNASRASLQHLHRHSLRFSRTRLDQRGLLARMLQPLLAIYAVVSTMVTSNWWYLGMAGRLSPVLCPKECVGQQDFVGVDYYWGIGHLGLHRLRSLVNATQGKYASAPVWPGGLSRALERLAKWFPGLPILVIENGSVENASGVTRPEYLRRHVERVRRAVAKGIRVVAYLCWSITSNRELGLPFDENSDFGLYRVELDTDPTLTRRETPSAVAYRELIGALPSEQASPVASSRHADAAR